MYTKEIALLRCQAMLRALLGKEHAPAWWDQYNKAFNKTPREAWEEDYDRVYRYVIRFN